MTGVRSYTTKIWRQPSSIGFSSADALSTSMDPPGEPVISTQKRPCQKIQNGSEFPELVAQNFRNPHLNLFWTVTYSTAVFGEHCDVLKKIISPRILIDPPMYPRRYYPPQLYCPKRYERPIFAVEETW